LPLAVSPVMIGLAFLLLLGRQGWLGPTLEALGLQVVFAPLGVLVGTLFVALPFTVREVTVMLQELGTSEEEAAATLGANRWQAFQWVTLPNLKHAIIGGTLLTVARSLGEFGAVLVLGGAIAMRTSTATTSIHLAIEERNMAAATGLSILLAAASIGLVGLLRRRGS
jgi:sulfate transport system permease protein